MRTGIRHELGNEIGGMVIVIRTDSVEFARLLADPYVTFVVRARADSCFLLDIELFPPGVITDAEEARVLLEGGRWVMERGDFRAEWDPVRRLVFARNPRVWELITKGLKGKGVSSG